MYIRLEQISKYIIDHDNQIAYCQRRSYKERRKVGVNTGLLESKLSVWSHGFCFRQIRQNNVIDMIDVRDLCSCLGMYTQVYFLALFTEKNSTQGYLHAMSKIGVQISGLLNTIFQYKQSGFFEEVVDFKAGKIHEQPEASCTRK